MATEVSTVTASGTVTSTVNEGDVYPIPIDEVDPGSFKNVRKHMNSKEVEDLAEDIFRNGLIHYPTVRPKTEDQVAQEESHAASGDPDKPYALVMGFRRFKALLLLHEQHPNDARFQTVLCRITSASDEDISFQQMSENIHRDELKVDETLEALQRFLAPKEEGGFGLTKKDVTERLGIKQAWLNQRMSFAEHAHPDLKASVDSGEIPFNQAYQLFTSLGGADTAKVVKASKDDKPDTEAAKAKLKEAAKKWKIQGEAAQAVKDRMEKYREKIAATGGTISKKVEAKVRNKVLDQKVKEAQRSQTSFFSDEAQYLILETHKLTKDLTGEDAIAARKSPEYAMGVRDILMQLCGSSNFYDVFSHFGIQRGAVAADTSAPAQLTDGATTAEAEPEVAAAPAPKKVVLRPTPKALPAAPAEVKVPAKRGRKSKAELEAIAAAKAATEAAAASADEVVDAEVAEDPKE